jgi:lipopolysaccharide biosynthesis glycosyltransferase
MHLLSTINSDFVVPFRVLVRSLTRRRRRTPPITWHVVESGLTGKEKAAIEAQVARTSVSINWQRHADELVAQLPLKGRALPAMYDRIFVGQVLPESIDRVIYLDGDLLLLDAIDHLWETDLDGAVVGAVQDAVIPYVSSPAGLRKYRDLGFLRTDPYFNAGVLIIDLNAWRAHQTEERAIDYLHRYFRSVNLADQDALNAVLRGRWTRVDDRWNITGGAAGRAHFDASGIGRSRMTAALQRPALIHFSGHLKPWLYPDLGGRWSDAYRDALLDLCPGYRFERSLRTTAATFYDRHLRTYLYPLERLVWRTSFHLP